MPYPAQTTIKRPCPTCGGQLVRKTEDQAKPLGMVCCLSCQFKSPIQAYAESVKASVVTEANQRRAQG